MSISIYNTLTHKKETFVPQEPGKVSMYVCGVTVYDYCHVGHARVYVAFDIVQRWLRRQYEVKYVRNFTDVDDKIINRANETGEEPLALASRYIDAYHEDMAALGVQVADVEPRVSTHIERIVEFVRTLEDKGFAYRVPTTSDVEGAGDDVYYRVNKFASYADLSGRDMEQLQSGARVNVDERKESPTDFALWKSAKPGEIAWDSPFGRGRPGWHIECSVMSKAHLGETFDIHGGGKDLIFPHHTNEIAQSEACHDGAKFSRYWMHNGFVNSRDEERCTVSQKPLGDVPKADRISDEHEGQTYYFATEGCREKFRADPATYLKMSKSLGNFFTIREVLKSFTPQALRWLLLSTHYRNPIGFSPRLVEEAEKKVSYIYETLRGVSDYLAQNEPQDGPGLAEVFKKGDAQWSPADDFAAGLNDDFGTPAAVAAFLEVLKVANLLMQGREKEVIGRKLKAKDRARLLGEWTGLVTPMIDILGVGDQEPEAFLTTQRELRVKTLGLDTAVIDAHLAARQTARTEKDWGAADLARDALAALGIEVRDTPRGQEWSVN